MQEIEMKFKIENISEMKEKLTKKGCILSDEIYQKDTIFVPDINNVKSVNASIWVRIRNIDNKKIELNLKKQSENISQSKEIEFEVNDYDKANDFLNTLGLKEWVRVEKTRISSTWKECNICIDSVKELGDFIELEILTDENNRIEFYENEILRIAKELEINYEDRIFKHYDTLINEIKSANNKF